MTEALELYLNEMKTTAKYFKNVGFDFFTKEPTTNSMFYLVALNLLFYQIVQVYSFYYYRDSFLDLIFSLAAVGFNLQIICILSSIYSNRKVFWALHLSLIEFHKKYGTRSILCAHNKKVKKFIDVFIKMLGTCIGICVIYPIIELVFTHNKVLSFGFILPFLEPESSIGHTINFLYQSLQALVTGLSHAALSRLYWQLFGNVLVRIELLKEVIGELKQEVLHDVDAVDYEQKLSLKLKEIVELHLEYLSSVDLLEMIGNKILFVVAVTAIANVSIVLLILSVEFWYPGVAILTTSTVTLLALCLLGTFLEVKAEQFSAVLYDVPWYLMPDKLQKKFSYILMASQLRKPITFWDYADVNVSSFLEIYNKIYSGFMLLVNSKN